MIKLAISQAGLAPFAVVGLIVFFVVFVSITTWALTRRKAEISHWSSLPLDDNPAPSVPQIIQPASGESPSAPSEPEKKSCGKCENCSCESVLQITTP